MRSARVLEALGRVDPVCCDKTGTLTENRLRVICACGAGGAIAATFNTPLAGLFFGIEIILRTYSVDALFAVMVSTMVADATAIAFVGNETFLVKFPHDVSLDATAAYAAVAGLAGLAALAGLLFSRSLYALEDAADRVWGDRPQWLKPVVGGVLVGALLLALPQLKKLPKRTRRKKIKSRKSLTKKNEQIL